MPKTKIDINDENEQDDSAKKQKTDARGNEEAENSEKTKDQPAMEQSREPDGPHLWHLGKSRFAKITEFEGSVNVDIRSYYSENGQLLPGKAGISLSMDQWDQFVKCVHEIDRAAKARRNRKKKEVLQYED